MSIGFATGLSFDEQRLNWDADGPRPLRWVIWYPAAQNARECPPSDPSWFLAGPVALDAPLLPSAKAYPVVLLSHGTGGVAAGLEWLARSLAQRGFVVVAVNHHGNTGAEPYRVEGFLCLWERARDLSALLSDESWRGRLGGKVSTNAYVAGFSAGAYAAMLLLGARVAYSQFEAANPMKNPTRGPKEFPALADHIPRLLAQNAVFRASWERRGDDYADDRFQAALALAPGRSVLGFDTASLANVRKPTRIIASDADNIAPATECAAWLQQHVPGSDLEIIGGANHYTFLSAPTLSGLHAAPEIFTDAPGVNRNTIHRRVAASAARLFAAA